VDSKTGFIYWGEVGPDASKDSIIGPRGYDEFNQARKPGFFGWPYFIGDNKPYVQVDYATNKVGEKFNPEKPVNNSPNNTGLNELPLPQKAFIWYPYALSEEFPLIGSSGRSATGGPIFRMEDFKNAKRPFPDYYEGKWLITEFMRGWIMSVTMDEQGNYKSMERFLPNEDFMSAIDMQFGPDGDLFVLEYGSAWFRGNDNAQIKKIEYNGGNRKPIVKATADVAAGALPLTVNFSSDGTMDYDLSDKDVLKYEWTIKSNNGFNQTLTEANPKITFDKAGVYSVIFKVTDSQGESNSQALEIKAGNEPPSVVVNILKGNKTFFFNKSAVAYEINVSDKEDGSLAEQKIKADEVALNFDYVPEGFDLIEIASSHKGTDEWAVFSTGLNLINKSDCKSCHLRDKKSVGPSYMDVAKKYKGDAAAQERIASKIITGGAGVWGDHAMSAHPQISPQNAATMVSYIMSLAEAKATTKVIPMKGEFITQVPANDNGRGGYLLRAAYKDKGTQEMESLTSEHIIALRNPSFDPEKADFKKGTKLMTTPSRTFSLVGNGSYLGYKNLDLSGIKPRSGAVGGEVEIHLDSPTGQLLGKSEAIIPKDIDYRTIIASLTPKPTKGGKPTPPLSASNIDFNMMRRLMAINTQISLEPVEGMHDIYFVFTNAKATPNDVLVQMIEIEFKNVGKK
jgi:cytochrome c